MGARPSGEWRYSARHRILGHERPGWCYPTGRCAYLPSVTCYRQSIKHPPPPVHRRGRCVALFYYRSSPCRRNGISEPEASKRVPSIFPCHGYPGRQASEFLFRRRNWVQAREAQIRFPALSHRHGFGLFKNCVGQVVNGCLLLEDLVQSCVRGKGGK